MKSTSNSRKKKKSIDNAIPAVKEVMVKKKKKKKKKKGEEKEKFGQEIDEIFKTAAKNKKKELSTVIETKKPKGDEGARRKEVGKCGNTTSDGGGGSNTGRKTKDGMTIYSSEELGFNDPNAGGTPLCPFECDCCF